MLFNSADFLIFFPIVVVIYFLIPEKFRYIWLLAASYYFYMQWNPAYGLLLLSSTLITYFGARILERLDKEKPRKVCLCIAVILNLSLLVYFKYTGMLVGFASKIFTTVSHQSVNWEVNILLPVGISFFTLQALGYLIDVYRGDIYPEHNILRYALFISFFPQLVAGPIERSKNLLKQLATPQKFSYENLRRGLLIMLYGFFLKVVVADRVSLFVDTIYNDPYTYNGIYIFVATAGFVLQIYCDFYGYSTIAKGAALVMGIKLMDNFQAPYLSKSIGELWRRWHLSLSTWFRDYLYIPLGGNRKGTLRKYLNLIIIFAVSGLWHGAAISFMIWGFIQAVYQIIGDYRRKFVKFISEKLDIADKSQTIGYKLFANLITMALFTFSLIFFRSNSLSYSKVMLKQLFSVNNWYVLFDGSLKNIGFSEHFIPVLIISVVLITLVDVAKYRGKDVVESFFAQSWWFRMLAVVALLLFVLSFGYYGSDMDAVQFIYFQF